MTEREMLDLITGDKPVSEDTIVAAAVFIGAADQALSGAAVSTVLQALQTYATGPEVFQATLDLIQARYPENQVIGEFVVNARAAFEEVMNRVYAKIINPRSGSACCPGCESANIGEAGGAYEFTLMKCYDCGYEEYCDSYQVGDWYV